MSDAPERIWMDWDEDYGDKVGLPYNHQGNIEYIRADLYEKLQAELAKQIRANVDLLGLLSATASNFTKTVAAYSSQEQP